MLGVNLGVMIAVGVPVGIIAVICAGVLWGKFCGKYVYAELPSNLREIADTEEEKKLPPFGTVLGIILIPLGVDFAEHRHRLSLFADRCQIYI